MEKEERHHEFDFLKNSSKKILVVLWKITRHYHSWTIIHFLEPLGRKSQICFSSPAPHFGPSEKLSCASAILQFIIFWVPPFTHLTPGRAFIKIGIWVDDNSEKGNQWALVIANYLTWAFIQNWALIEIKVGIGVN